MIAYFFIIYGVYHYLGFLAALMAAVVLLGIQSLINRLEGREFVQVLFIFIATIIIGHEFIQALFIFIAVIITWFVTAILYLIKSGGFS